MELLHLGSSPRGRGTRRCAGDQLQNLRFIPAGAGNAATSSTASMSPSVHPRGGGERGTGQPATGGARGSSPRGRGTPLRAMGRAVVFRFIPAGAGNARPALPRPALCAVHPRGGGERILAFCVRNNDLGSSPRGRGTLMGITGQDHFPRFIPAGAGNAPPRVRAGRPVSVHPRGGGERDDQNGEHGRAAGSSPRGRGTRQLHSPRTCRTRFIPAGAGNAPRTHFSTNPRAVHPRGGGERLASRWNRSSRRGSSPRGRGTRPHPRSCQPGARFIPAGAGNASGVPAGSCALAVHPRGGGERTPLPCALVWLDGSSPRGRGTHRFRAGLGFLFRFIPAGAGNARTRRL